MRPLLGGLREQKALAATARQAKARAIELVGPSIAGRPYRVAWDVERAVRDGMKRVTWVFRCVHIRASKSAGLPVIVRRGDPEEGDPIADHPLRRLLNAYSAPEESAYIFRYRLSAIMDLNPQGAFVEVVRGRVTDVPQALRLLPPAYTAPIPGSAGNFLDGFRVHIPGLPPRDLAPQDVVWCKHPHPTDPYDGLNPMQANGIAIDTEWLAKLYQRNFLKNDARGGGLLIVAGEIGPDDLDELQASVDAATGPNQAGRVRVIEGTARDAGTGEATGEVGGVHFVDTAVSPREAAYIEMRKITKEEIHGAWGTPTSIGAADSSNRTYDNADADYYMFWNDTMVDHCRMIDRPFDLIDTDPETFVAHDFTSVEVLQRWKVARQKFALDELKEGAIVWDEYRDETGRDPYKSGGDVVLRSLSMVPVAGNVEVFAVAAGGAGTGASVPGKGGAWNTEDGVGRIAADDGGWTVTRGREPSLRLKDASEVPFGRFGVPATALKARRRERGKRIRGWEGVATRRLRAFFERQEQAVLEKLRTSKVREGTRHWVPAGRPTGDDRAGTKAITAPDLFDRAKWDELLRAEGEALVAEVAGDFGEEAFAHIADATKGAPEGSEGKADEQFDPAAHRLVRFIRARGNKIVGANDTTFAQIADTLAEGEAAGEVISELASRVAQVFADAVGARAETIARTEVISAANMGTMEGARQSGVVETKVWLATEDDRTRETHSELDGTAVALDDVFESSSGETLDYPGDPSADGSETINCRCTITFETSGGPLL